METIDYKIKFVKHINKIEDVELHNLALNIMMHLPEHFWTDPSSSSGNHHPPDEAGIHGLLIHKFRVYRAAMFLCESMKYPEYVIDCYRFAALFHDCTRLGLQLVRFEYSDNAHHADTAVEFIESFIGNKTPLMSLSLRLIQCHSGPWGNIKPEDEMSYLFHYADNIASKLHLIM